MGPSWEGLEPPPEVVCDAGPLIHLDEIDCLDLLGDFARVIVPEEVWEEVRRHRPKALDHSPVRLVRRSAEAPTDPATLGILRAFSLDKGEQAAFAILMFHPSAVFLTDDAAARLAAKALGLRSHGTLGVLLRSLRRGQRTRSELLIALLAIPTRSTLHIRRALLEEVIRQVEES